MRLQRLSQRASTMLLDCMILPIAVAFTINNFRGLLDTLCKATGTTPGITMIGQYPCGGSSPLIGTAFLTRQPSSTVHSYLAAIHPYTGPYPNEIWPLNTFWPCLLATCLLLICPRLYFRARSALWLLAAVVGFIGPLLGLLTHPLAPPSTYWATGFPLMGAILQSQKIVFRFDRWAGYAHVCSGCFFTFISMLVLPRVYPHIVTPWWAFPLLCASTVHYLLSLAGSRDSILRRTAPQAPNTAGIKIKEAAQTGATSSDPQAPRRVFHSPMTQPAAKSSGSLIEESPFSRKHGPAAASAAQLATMQALPALFSALPCTEAMCASDSSDGVQPENPLHESINPALSSGTVHQFPDGWDSDTGPHPPPGAVISAGMDAENLNASSQQAARVPEHAKSSSDGSRSSGNGADDACMNITDNSVGLHALSVAAAAPVNDQLTTGQRSEAIANLQGSLGVSPQAFKFRPYVSPARRHRIVSKIPHMEPHQLTAEFVAQLSVAFSQHPTCPYMLVGVSMRPGCIELVMDLVRLLAQADKDADSDPFQLPFIDPSVWLQHLHVLPPPGTQVLTQACGRVWRSTWETDMSPPQWVLSPFPLPMGQLPRLITAPCVILHSLMEDLVNSGSEGVPGSLPVRHCSTLTVAVSVFGIVPDVSVRCSGRYMETNVVMNARQQGASESGGVRTFTIELVGPVPRQGLLMIESKLGWMVSDGTPVLLTQDAKLALELEQVMKLASSKAPTQQTEHASLCPGFDQAFCGYTRAVRAEHHDFIIDLGSWFDYMDAVSKKDSGATSACSTLSPLSSSVISGAEAICPCPAMPGFNSIYEAPAMRAHMSNVGISLLVASAGNGCPHTTASIMQGLLALGHTYTWVLAQCEAEDFLKLTLLQRAVSSACLVTKRLILNLGEEHGSPWTLSTSSSCNSNTDCTSASFGNSYGLASEASTSDDGGALAHSILQEYDAACIATMGSADTAPADSVTGVTRFCHATDKRLCDKHEQFRDTTSSSTPTHKTAGSITHGHHTCIPTADSDDIMLPRSVDMAVEETTQDASMETSLKQHCSTKALDDKDAQHLTQSGQASASASANPGSIIQPHTATTHLYSSRQTQGNIPEHTEVDYRVWLSRNNSVHSSQFYSLIFFVILCVFIRKAVHGYSSQEYASVLLIAFHVARLLGQRFQPAWSEQHAELQNAIWQCLRLGPKLMAVALGWHYGAEPPVPFLMVFDWFIEGVLPTLFAQVRPSVTAVFCCLDAYLSASLYMRHQIVSSPAVAVSFACAWNIACVVLCVTLDAHNRQSFLRSTNYGRVQSSCLASKVKTQ